MANGGELDGAILASGVALGINLDATLILTPTVVAMMGRSWWLPVWAARALRVPASPPATSRRSLPLLAGLPLPIEGSVHPAIKATEP